MERDYNCGICGDVRWVGQNHLCWAATKIHEKPLPVHCPRCGYEMNDGGFCLRWTCGTE